MEGPLALEIVKEGYIMLTVQVRVSFRIRSWPEKEEFGPWALLAT